MAAELRGCPVLAVMPAVGTSSVVEGVALMNRKESFWAGIVAILSIKYPGGPCAHPNLLDPSPLPPPPPPPAGKGFLWSLNSLTYEVKKVLDFNRWGWLRMHVGAGACEMLADVCCPWYLEHRVAPMRSVSWG